MKPCDVRTVQDCNELKVQGIGFNGRSITVDSNGVFIELEPFVRIKVYHFDFKRFAEWYLSDQEEE